MPWPVLRLLRLPWAALVAWAATSCAEAQPRPAVPDDTLLYYPAALAAAGPGQSKLWVLSTNFDRRFGVGWVSEFDVAAYLRNPAAPAPGLRRLVKVPSLGAAMTVDRASEPARHLFVSHRGRGLITQLDVGTDGGLSCGGGRDDGGVAAAEGAETDCDQEHLVDLPGLFRDSVDPRHYRALFDPAALAFLPGRGDDGRGGAADRLLVGTLADRGYLLALDLVDIAGSGPRLRPRSERVVRLRVGVGALLQVGSDELLGAGSLSAGSRDGGQILRVGLAPAWSDTRVEGRGVALNEPLDGEAVAALALPSPAPEATSQVWAVARDPDVLFDVVLFDASAGQGVEAAAAGDRQPRRAWVLGGRRLPLAGVKPQALASWSDEDGEMLAVVGTGDDAVYFARVAAGGLRLVRRLDLGSLDEMPLGGGAVALQRVDVPSAGDGSRRLLVVSLFYGHRLAVVDVSSPSASDYALVGTARGTPLPPARRFL